MQDLSSLPGDQRQAPALRAQSSPLDRSEVPPPPSFVFNRSLLVLLHFSTTHGTAAQTLTSRKHASSPGQLGRPARLLRSLPPGGRQTAGSTSCSSRRRDLTLTAEEALSPETCRGCFCSELSKTERQGHGTDVLRRSRHSRAARHTRVCRLPGYWPG